MADREPADNGDRRARPRLPLGIAIASIVVAIASASLLIYFLYKETRGPGEILREFARRVDRHDCEGSYDLLDASVHAQVDEQAWCDQLLATVDDGLDADFTMEQAVLEGDSAAVEISGVGLTDWELRRFGDRSWRVLLETVAFEVEASVGSSR